MWAIGIAMTVMAGFMLLVAGFRPAGQVDIASARSVQLAETLAAELNAVHQAAVRFAQDNPTAIGTLTDDALLASPYIAERYIELNTETGQAFRADWEANLFIDPASQRLQVVTYMVDPASLITQFRVIPEEVGRALTALTDDPVTSGLIEAGDTRINAGLRGITGVTGGSAAVTIPPGILPTRSVANPVRLTSLGLLDRRGGGGSTDARAPFTQIAQPSPLARLVACNDLTGGDADGRCFEEMTPTRGGIGGRDRRDLADDPADPDPSDPGDPSGGGLQ